MYAISYENIKCLTKELALCSYFIWSRNSCKQSSSVPEKVSGLWGLWEVTEITDDLGGVRQSLPQGAFPFWCGRPTPEGKKRPGDEVGRSIDRIPE